MQPHKINFCAVRLTQINWKTQFSTFVACMSNCFRTQSVLPIVSTAIIYSIRKMAAESIIGGVNVETNVFVVV